MNGARPGARDVRGPAAARSAAMLDNDVFQPAVGARHFTPDGGRGAGAGGLRAPRAVAWRPGSPSGERRRGRLQPVPTKPFDTEVDALAARPRPGRAGPVAVGGATARRLRGGDGPGAGRPAARSPSRVHDACPAGRGAIARSAWQSAAAAEARAGAPGRDLWGAAALPRRRRRQGGRARRPARRWCRRRAERRAAAHVPGDRRSTCAARRRASRDAERALRQRCAPKFTVAHRRQAARGAGAADRRQAQGQGLRRARGAGRYGDSKRVVKQRRRFSGRHAYRSGHVHAARSRVYDMAGNRRDQEGQAPHHVRLRAGRRELELGGAAAADGHRQRVAGLVLGRRRATVADLRRARRARWSRRARTSSTWAASRRSATGPPVAVDEEIDAGRRRSIERARGGRRADLGRHLQAGGRRGRDRGGRGDRQRRLRAARPAAGRRVRARPARRWCSCTRAWRRRARCSIPDAYDDVVADVVGVPARADGRSRWRAGVAPEQIVLDPGPDFAKTPAQTVAVLRRLDAAARRSGARCCWRSRARTSSARSPAAAPRERGRGDARRARLRRRRAGAAILRVHDVAAAADFLAVRAVLRGRARARAGRGPDARALPST